MCTYALIGANFLGFEAGRRDLANDYDESTIFESWLSTSRSSYVPYRLGRKLQKSQC